MTPARTRVARKTLPATLIAPGTRRPQLGDLVIWTSSNGNQTIGPGRYCADVTPGVVCVRFEDPLGCRRVGLDNLSLATEPNGPECDAECFSC